MPQMPPPLPAGHQVILLHPAAPPKPAWGAACNGCGVCCAAEPCPLGMLLSRRRHGACRALQWSDAGGRYVCGVLAAPRSVLPWLPARLTAVAQKAARRWIAAAQGCDSAAEVRPGG